MRFTYLWAALVALLAGYVVYDIRQQGAGESLAAGEVRAFSFPRDQVTRFSLTREGQTITVVRDGDDWRVKQPLEDDAEETAVDGFLFALEMERLREFRDADEKAAPDWAKYGLDHPGVVVEWTSAKKTEKLEVSSKNAFDGSFYVRAGDRLLLGRSSLAQSTNRSLGGFRSRRIWRHADAEVTGAEAHFEDHARDFKLSHDARGWALSPKPKFAIDPERLPKWLDAVEDLTASDFVKDGPTPADLKQYGLDRPRLQVDVDYKVGDEKPGRWTLFVGPERGGDVFFYTSDRAVILKTAAASARKLLVSPEYFRDGRAPFSFDVERAREVRVRVGGADHVIKKGDAAWTLSDAKPGEQVNEAELVEVLTAARALEAVDYPAGPTFKGAPLLEVRDAAGKALLKLAMGEPYAAKSTWNQGAELRAVRVTNAAGEATFGLPKAQIETLIKPRLIKKAPTGG